MRAKGDRLRMERVGAPGGGVDHVIMDGSSGDVLLVSDAGRFYVRVTPEAVAELRRRAREAPDTAGPAADTGEAAVAASPEPEVEVRRTGEGARILGTDAARYEVRGPRGQALGWVAEEQGIASLVRRLAGRLETFFGTGDGDGRTVEDHLWERGLPLRSHVLGRRPDGSLTTYERWEVTELAPGPVPDSLFRTPPGYAERTLRELMGGG